MNQTEHYGLNQWALTDRIEMKDFNADNAKIDAALAALSGLQGGEIARLDAALAAARAELAGTQAGESARLDAAMAAETKRVNAELAKKALASDLATAKSSLETAVAPKLEQVKLLDTSFTLSGSSIAITVPGSQIARCSVVMAAFTHSGADNVVIHVNNTTNSYISSGGSGTSSGLAYLYGNRSLVLIFFPMKGACPHICGISYGHDICQFFYSPVTYGALTKFTLKSPYNEGTIHGSGTIKIYGLQ